MRLFVLCLMMIGMLAACAGTVEQQKVSASPAWVAKQCDERDGVIYAVGSSNFVHPIARSEDAELAARGALGTCLSGKVSQRSDGESTSTTSSADLEVADSRIVDRWVDPQTGIEYALAAGRRSTP